MKKIDGLQGLRAVAFIAIFISHTSVGNYSELGAWGVSIFLVLSGFVMVYSYWNKREMISLMPKDVIGFAWNKIKKLYPLHIVMMLSCILIALYDIFIIHVLTIRKLIVDVVLHTFLLQIWIPDSTYYVTLNGVSWYLCVCVLLYLVFPFALKFLSECDKKNGIRRIFIALMGLGVIQILIAFIAYRYGGQNWNDPWSMQWITYYCPVSRLVDFLIGCSVGYLFVRKDDFLLALREMIPDKKGIARFHTSTQVTAIINVFSVVHMMLILYLWHSVIGGGLSVGYDWIKYTLIFTPSTIITILLACSSRGFFNTVLSSRFLVHIGNISGYAFLIHKTVIKYCEFVLNQIGFNSDVLIAMVAVVITMIAVYLWKAITERKRLKL